MIGKTCLIIIFVFFAYSYGKPVTSKTKKHSTKSAAKAPKVDSSMDALKYFHKFGYNQCGSSRSTASNEKGPLCQSSFQTMLEHFQTVFRLPVTGKLDDSTRKLMNTPRCSLGDYPLSFSAFRPWPNATLKWRLNNEIPKFGKEKTRLLVQEAFDDWAKYAPLKFHEAVGDETAHFNISFQTGDHNDGYPFDGSGGTLAHAFFPTDGKIHFDSTEQWTDQYDGEGFNFRLVASHEFGHALGLAHSYDPKALMYPFYQLIQPKDLLPKDDRDGIRALYGTNANNKPTTFAPTTGKTTTTISKKTTTQKQGKPTKSTPTKPETNTAQALPHDRCARYLDAVFVGPDQWLYTLDYGLVWRYSPEFGHWDTQGIPTSQLFQGAEQHNMAGIYSPKTNKLYLFKGYRVWQFSSFSTLDTGFPRRLYGTGTPYNPIAALYDKDQIWLLKGGLLFQFNEKELRYESKKRPKRLEEYFRGIPKNVRTAFTYGDKHYFFTEPDRNVYIFDTKTRRVVPGYPKPMTTGWFACQEQH